MLIERWKFSVVTLVIKVGYGLVEKLASQATRKTGKKQYLLERVDENEEAFDHGSMAA